MMDNLHKFAYMLALAASIISIGIVVITVPINQRKPVTHYVGGVKSFGSGPVIKP